MEDMQAQMGAILNNPEMMQKIMSMAQALNQSPPAEPTQEPTQEPAQQPQAQAFPDIDIGLLQKLSGFASQSGIDHNQKNLLNALGPYLSNARIAKLEKAMRAAKMARMASSVLGQSSIFGIGR